MWPRILSQRVTVGISLSAFLPELPRILHITTNMIFSFNLSVVTSIWNLLTYVDRSQLQPSTNDYFSHWYINILAPSILRQDKYEAGDFAPFRVISHVCKLQSPSWVPSLMENFLLAASLSLFHIPSSLALTSQPEVGSYFWENQIQSKCLFEIIQMLVLQTMTPSH